MYLCHLQCELSDQSSLLFVGNVSTTQAETICCAYHISVCWYWRKAASITRRNAFLRSTGILWPFRSFINFLLSFRFLINLLLRFLPRNFVLLFPCPYSRVLWLISTSFIDKFRPICTSLTDFLSINMQT